MTTALGLGLGLPFRRGGSFTPASLFAAGEQGAWYDPSDLTTLFQDASGTTPTTMETRVRLMLDKSKGLVLGPELVPSPYAGSTSGSWAIGAASITRNSSSGGGALLDCITSSSKNYKVALTVANLSGDSFYFSIDSAATLTRITANGSYNYTLRGGDSVFRVAPWAGSAGEATITNISVREVPGNHATAPSDADSPILRARYNLLQYSEDFSNAAWTKYSNTTVSADASVAPNGTMTADLVYPATSGSARGAYVAFTGAFTLTTSIYAKASGKSWLQIVGTGGSSSTGVWFDVSTGVVGTQTAGYAGTITNEGNGWYRCVVSHPTQTNGFFEYRVVDGDNVSSVTANGTDGLLWWGADGRRTSDAALNIPAYQRVGNGSPGVFDYDTNGFPPYLAVDGTDDSFSTASIDFSGTDKMTVFAGVTKLSDAAGGIVAELGTDYTSLGSWYIGTVASPAAYQYAGHGNRGGVASDAADAPIAAGPNTSVLAAQQNLNNNTPATIRRNGALAGSSANTTFGGGNFGNHPLFIGRRNNSSLPFNGRIYSLIIRGAATTTPLIASTEQWVAEKMRLPI
jgi:hypothetical protein